jgi:hypothetical protein
MKTRPVLIIAAMLYSTAALAEGALHAESEAAIEFLLARVASSDLEFVRNGKTHSPAEAVKHMRRKYEYYEDRIDTAEDFITLAATRSMISGKQYTIRSHSGVQPAAAWLKSVLAEYRAAQSGAGAQPE